MADLLNRIPQTRSAYIKAFALLLGVLMILGTVGLWAYGAQLRGQVTGAMNLASTLSPRRFAPAEMLSKKIELNEEQKTERSDTDKQFAELLKTHPVFGAPPNQGPPQAAITGILGDMALINNKWMKVGETQDGVKLVMTMTSGRALVEIEGKQKEINIFTDMPNKPLPPGPPALMGGGGSDRGGRGERYSNRGGGGGGGGSTFEALRDAFASKKDIRDNKEVMGRLSKMDNKDVYQLYQKVKASGLQVPYSDQEINDFFKQGGFKNEQIYDGMENRKSGSGGGSKIPFGGSKSGKAAKSGKGLDPERLAELKAEKAARASQSDSPKPMKSENSGMSAPPKSSSGPSFGPPSGRSGKGKSKKNRDRMNDRGPSMGSSSSSKPSPGSGSFSAPPIPKPSKSSGIVGPPISGPPSSIVKSKSIDRPLSPKALERSMGGGGSSSGSSRPDRPSPIKSPSKPGNSGSGNSGSGSSRPDRPSPSKSPSKPESSSSVAPRPDRPSPSKSPSKPGSSSSVAPRPDRPSPSELRTKSGSSSGFPSGSSKATRSFYPGGQKKSKIGSSDSGFSGPTGSGGPKGKKGSRKVQNPYRNNE